MKKLIPALLISAAAITGCKKDSQSSILGKWNLVKTEVAFTGGDGTIKDTTIVITGGSGYVQFNSDGTGISTTGVNVSVGAPNAGSINAGNFNYQLSGSTLTFKGDPQVQETISFQGSELVLTYIINQSLAGGATFTNRQYYNR